MRTIRLLCVITAATLTISVTYARQVERATTTNAASLIPGRHVLFAMDDPMPADKTVRESIPQMPGFPRSMGGDSYFAPSRGLAFADLDGNGDLEVIASGTDSKVYAWDHSGNLMQGFPVSVIGDAQYAPSVADLDGDGDVEIVQLTRGLVDGGRFYVFDHLGNVIPEFPISIGNNNLTGCATIYDLDQDGQMEIVFGERDYPIGRLHVFEIDGSEWGGNWPVVLDSVPAASAAVGDVDADGVMEIFYLSYTSMYLLNVDGSSVPSWPRQIPDVNFSYQSAALADVDGDTDLEIVVGVFDFVDGSGYFYVFQQNGTVYPGWPKRVNTITYCAPTVTDLDGDGDLEILGGQPGLYSGYSEFLWAWDTGGRVKPGFPYSRPNGGGSDGPLTVADIDGDGSMEVFADYNIRDSISGRGYLLGIDASGNDLPGFPLRPLGWTYMNGAAIADVDGDGDYELGVLSSHDVGVDVNLYDLPQRYRPSSGDWKNYHARNSRGGFYQPSLADLDDDGDVDPGDFNLFTACLSGPGQPVAANCRNATLDGDDDVDLMDFGLIQGSVLEVRQPGYGSVDERLSSLGLNMRGDASELAAVTALMQLRNESFVHSVSVDQVGDPLPGPAGDHDYPGGPDGAPTGFNIAEIGMIYAEDVDPSDDVDDSFLYIVLDVTDTDSAGDSDSNPPCQFDVGNDGLATSEGSQSYPDQGNESYAVTVCFDVDPQDFNATVGNLCAYQSNGLTLRLRMDGAYGEGMITLFIDDYNTDFLSTDSEGETVQTFPPPGLTNNPGESNLDDYLQLQATGNDVEFVLKRVDSHLSSQMLANVFACVNSDSSFDLQPEDAAVTSLTNTQEDSDPCGDKDSCPVALQGCAWQESLVAMNAGDCDLLPDPVEAHMCELGVVLDGVLADGLGDSTCEYVALFSTPLPAELFANTQAVAMIDAVPDCRMMMPGPDGSSEEPREFMGSPDPNGFNIACSLLWFVPDSNAMDGVDDSFIYIAWDIADQADYDGAPGPYDADDNGCACAAASMVDEARNKYYAVDLLAGADLSVFNHKDRSTNSIDTSAQATVRLDISQSGDVALHTVVTPDSLKTIAFPTADGAFNPTNACIDAEVSQCADALATGAADRNNIELIIKQPETSGAFGPPAAPDSDEARVNRTALARLVARLQAGSSGDLADEEVAVVAAASSFGELNVSQSCRELHGESNSEFQTEVEVLPSTEIEFRITIENSGADTLLVDVENLTHTVGTQAEHLSLEVECDFLSVYLTSPRRGLVDFPVTLTNANSPPVCDCVSGDNCLNPDFFWTSCTPPPFAAGNSFLEIVNEQAGTARLGGLLGATVTPEPGGQGYLPGDTIEIVFRAIVVCDTDFCPSNTPSDATVSVSVLGTKLGETQPSIADGGGIVDTSFEMISGADNNTAVVDVVCFELTPEQPAMRISGKPHASEEGSLEDITEPK